MPPVFPHLVVYVPLMHPELLPSGLPEGLSVLWPGVSASRSFPRGSRVAAWRPAMPYSPAEAEACLTDLEALGRDMLRGTPVRAASAVRPDAASDFAPEEAAALARFAGQEGASASATRPAAGGQADLSDSSALTGLADREEAKRRAHRLLLLAWLQEERVRDMGGLLRRYHAGSTALARALGQEEDGGIAPAAREDGTDSDGAGRILREMEDARDLLPPWRFVLEQMAFFLPEDAALFTADPRLLREAAFSPCPECEDSAAAWPFLRSCGEAVRRRLQVGRAPLWRLLGLPGSQEGKPWLDEVRFVLMYQGEER